MSNYTHCMFGITNCVHQLHQDDIMFKKILMLRTNVLRFFVIKTIFHHSKFVDHIQNHMVSEDLAIIILCGSIQN